jgi:hypothetical protein
VERIIQFLDEVDELVMLMRHASGTWLGHIDVHPGLLTLAIAGTLLPL